MKRLAMHFLGVLAWLAVATASAADLVEGKDYVRLKNPQPVETGKKAAPIATTSSRSSRAGCRSFRRTCSFAACP